MRKNAKHIEVRSAEGRLMFSLHLYDEERAFSRRADGAATAAPQEEPQGSRGANGQTDPDAITEAQRKYVFRILAERGIEGDDAQRHLKELFGVETLNGLSKREASTMIEKLLDAAEAK